jgi:hypothetical protein
MFSPTPDFNSSNTSVKIIIILDPENPFIQLGLIEQERIFDHFVMENLNKLSTLNDN